MSLPDENSPSTIQRINTLYPGIRPLVYRVLTAVQSQTRRRMNVVQGLRSFDEQLADYSKGRALSEDQWFIVNPALVVTNAKPGMSFHCYGLGFDCAWAGVDPYLSLLSAADRLQMWEAYGQIGKDVGFQWGGDFRLANGANDKPHLEYNYGLTISELLELYDRGGLEHVWGYLDTVRGVPIGQSWMLRGM